MLVLLFEWLFSPTLLAWFSLKIIVIFFHIKARVNQDALTDEHGVEHSKVGIIKRSRIRCDLLRH